MSEKDVVENVDSPGAISIPTASNFAKGIASFNAKDFTVNNGEVSAIWERGVPQYVGIIVGQEEGEGDLTWTVDDASLVDNRPVKIGEYIMLREDAFGFARGEVFVITGISADENFLAITDNQSVFSLQGEVGPKGDKGDKGDNGDKGDKGDKGDRGEQGKEGAGIADIVDIDYPHGEFTSVQYDTTDGIKMQGIAKYLRDDSETYQIPTDIDVPLVVGAGISISKKENEKKVEIKSLNSNLENGTADVLIQTTDTNHSFKVMKDGRAKVQSAPTESDDVVRKKELSMKTSQEVFVDGSLPTSADARIWIDTGISTSELSKIYGVDKVGQENPTLTRTDDAVGLSYDIGTSEITSDFDNCYPWSNMQEVTDSSGNVFIKIPKFYSKVTKNTDGTYKYQISGTQHEGFTTLFVDGKGNELDYILIGKYEGSAVVSGDNNYDAQNQKVKSKSGQTVLVSITRGAYRTRCRNVGKGYQQYDFLIDAIIKELFMIEFATTNSQSVMQGYTASSNSAAVTTGRTNTVKTTSGSEISNTDGKHACKYRGIENPFGNVWKWCDGINFDTEKIYVCEDPEHYADDKHDAPYTYMGDRLMSEGYLKEVTPFAKNPLIGYATAIGAGNTTHYSDYYYVNNTGIVLFCGGAWRDGAAAGLWSWHGRSAASNAGSLIGGRLCYKPIRN